METPTQPRVLCVDDDRDVADSVAELLRLVGFEVQVCHNGPAALVAARGFHPDVCMLALNLPGMENNELTVCLREQAAGRPVLFVALTESGNEDRFWAESGFHLRLVKPVDPHDLLRVVDELWQLLYIAGRPARYPDGLKSNLDGAQTA